jgi:hypothetical protein
MATGGPDKTVNVWHEGPAKAGHCHTGGVDGIIARSVRTDRQRPLAAMEWPWNSGKV